MDMLVCEKVTREYVTGEKKNKHNLLALDNINLNIHKGEIFGLLGPNGAGKTTLIKIISTLLYPSKGKVYIDGLDVVESCKEVKKNIGVLLSNNRSLYMKLTAKENLEFFCSLYGIPYKLQKRKIDYVLDTVNLLKRKDDYVENFSHGMLQRLNIARSIIHDPKFIILDEPTNGLDPISTNELRNTILRLNNEGKTILISTHNMEEADILSNRLAIINSGRIICEGKPECLKNNLGRSVYEIQVSKDNIDNNILAIKNALKDSTIIYSNNDKDTATIRIITEKNYNFNHISNILDNENVKIETMSLHNLKLEDVFIASVNNSVNNKGENEYANIY